MSRTVTNKFGDEYTYDDNGNLIHIKDSYGHEAWWEYDDNGNKTYYINSTGFEAWYDSDGNEISKEEYDKIYNR